jgi:hypothetical protein
MNEEHLNLMNQTLPTAEELIAEWKEFYRPETSPNKTSPNKTGSNEVSREWEYPEDHNPYEEITRLKKAAKIAVRLATEIAYRETTVSQATVNDDTIKLVARMLGKNAPSNRTIELVHEILGTTVTKK